MRYVRMVEDSKRVAVQAMRLTSGKVGHILATSVKQLGSSLVEWRLHLGRRYATRERGKGVAIREHGFVCEPVSW
jgi:hypothetical protein